MNLSKKLEGFPQSNLPNQVADGFSPSAPTTPRLAGANSEC